MPSGKSAATENFPVGSILISRALRPHVAAFYAFARAIDDIADDPVLESAEKIHRLNGFERTLLGQDQGPGFEKACALRKSLTETNVTPAHACDLVAAFRQDAEKSRYADWDDLMAYCRLSAAPVGRYLLDLHGEDQALYPSSDALCAALQVINHLQDCGDDYKEIDRVYLPLDWMTTEGAKIEDLTAAHVSPELRRVLDRCLDGCRELMAETEPLHCLRNSCRLALESAVIIQIAESLISLLRKRDPLATRVGLSKAALIRASGAGLLKGMFARL